MSFLKLLLFALGLMVIALSGLALKLFFSKKGISGGSCQAAAETLGTKGTDCGCGTTSCDKN